MLHTSINATTYTTHTKRD